LLEFSKCSYYKDKIENANTRQLFKIVDGFFTPRSPVLPTHNSSTQLVEDFNDFFIQRMIGFGDELQKTFKTGTCYSIAGEAVCQELFSFSLTSCTSVHHVIKALSTKSCPLDPMPTRLLKDHLDDIVPTITAVVNESLLTGVFLTCLIRPLLKKPDLDQEILKNYRPIANIPFSAKIIENVVALQTYSYLETNKLMPPLQSA